MATGPAAANGVSDRDSNGSSSTPSSPRTYVHTHARRTVLPLLRSFLPQTLPVVRRLQLHFYSRHAVVIATFPPAAADTDVSDASDDHAALDGSQPPFSIILLDRSRAPETEAWLFASSETSTHISTGLAREIRMQLLALLAHTSRIALPPSYPAGGDPKSMKLGAVAASTLAIMQGWDGGDVAALEQRWVGGSAAVRNAYETAATDTHDSNRASTDPRAASTAADRAAAGGVIPSVTVPYGVFLIPPEIMRGYVARVATEHTAPAGLVWDHVRVTDHTLVISRTHIPRTSRTLLLMPSVCLRVPDPDGSIVEAAEAWHPETAHATYQSTPGRPVGWAFLSPDGSLATLHVEADYRGRGIGQVLAKRALGLLGPHPHQKNASPDAPTTSVIPPCSEPDVLVDQRAGFPLHTDVLEAWGYAHVARDNKASVGVMRAVGARADHECFWVVADIGEAEAELDRLVHAGTEAAAS